VDPGGQMWKLKACWVEWRVNPTAAEAEMGSIGRCTGARSPASRWAPLPNHPISPDCVSDGLCIHDSGLSPPFTTKCPAREPLHLRPGK
jgi:hypothetical protein